MYPGGVGEKGLAFSWNVSLVMKIMGSVIMIVRQCGSHLEDSDFRLLWRSLFKAPTTSLHSGVQVCIRRSEIYP